MNKLQAKVRTSTKHAQVTPFLSSIRLPKKNQLPTYAVHTMPDSTHRWLWRQGGFYEMKNCVQVKKKKMRKLHCASSPVEFRY